MTTIRKAVFGDNEKLRPLLEQIALLHYKRRPDLFRSTAPCYSADNFEEKLNDSDQYIYIAESDNHKVIGYIFGMVIHYRNHPVYRDFDCFYIDNFCVDENRRSQGVGKMLLEKCSEQAKKLNCHHIDLGVWEFNADAIAFYKSCGMKAKAYKMELIL